MSSQTPTDQKHADQPDKSVSDDSARKDAATSKPKPKKARGWLLRGLGVLVLLGIIAWGAWYFIEGRWYEETEDAYINGNVVQITPQMAGTVISIGADTAISYTPATCW